MAVKLDTSKDRTGLRRLLSRSSLYFAIVLLCVLWSLPTFGLLVSSFRSEREINESGWWKVFAPERDNPTYMRLKAEADQAIARVDARQADLAEAQAAVGSGVEGAEEQLARAQDRLASAEERLAEAQAALDASDEPETITFGSKKWREQWTTENYRAVLEAEGMDTAFFNSLLVTIPSVIIPITLAAFAAYAFAWLKFPGRDLFFAIVVVLMVVPLHTALIPILRLYVNLDLGGTYLGIWLAHTGFGMPLAIYLLYGYISTIPAEMMEAASIDGASPFTAFTRLILPVSVPAIASFAIFQFLWVWNDLLVALVFLGTKQENRVVTRVLAEMIGSKGQDWEILTAGAFITMLVPLFIFFALQRYFVRGMMAGSVKG